eukprot:CAMPEP_0195517320 /NCGR_PEP_ID=MMETSP0794_2-20130614/10359_1 /TAXON_ID=515487 /ORGANISM="Stephanopyxis turris, Strain CCMP 815" /LENGTH=65 /DNA_ID=CAMNT_0040646103 /DNA_START=42 /DNA_END=239 /DNA_ORIENTATION=+
MVKQKNHTARNASYKAHRNGIKKGIKQRYMALKGRCPRFLRNQRFVKQAQRRQRIEAEAAADGGQ